MLSSRASAIRHVLIPLILALSQSDPAAAQIVCAPGWTQDSIRSDILGETRRLRIALPCGYELRANASERYAVLIVLDAHVDLLFGAAVSNARYLAAPGTPAIPPLLVVGIETGGPRRAYNMSPLPPGSTSVERGGAPTFVKFLQGELRPYLDHRYRTLPFTVIAGHSMSGLFAVYAFGHAPEFIGGAIAISPSLSLRGIFQQVTDSLRSRARPGRLFLATSTTEQTLDSLAQIVAAGPRGPTSVDWTVTHSRLPPTPHILTPLQGMIDGLRFVFGGLTLNTDQLFSMYDAPAEALQSFEDTRRRYVQSAREFGLPERIPRAVLLTWANVFGAGGSVGGEALRPLTPDTDRVLDRICRELAASYPDLWSGYSCLADTQLRRGNRSAALTNYRQAIEAANRAGEENAVARITAKVQAVIP